MKYLKNINEWSDNLVPLKSDQKTANEKYKIGSSIIFNFYVDGVEKPFRYQGKVVKNDKYNRLTVEIENFIYNRQTVDKPGYGVKLPNRIGDIIDIHSGNVI
jgi:hypothetical protein